MLSGFNRSVTRANAKSINYISDETGSLSLSVRTQNTKWWIVAGNWQVYPGNRSSYPGPP